MGTVDLGHDRIIAPDGLGACTSFGLGEGNQTLLLGGSGAFDTVLGAGADQLVVAPNFLDTLLPRPIADFDVSQDQLLVALGDNFEAERSFDIARDIAADQATVTLRFPMLEDHLDSEFRLILELAGAPDIAESDILFVENLFGN